MNEKTEPEIVKILREEERLGKLHFNTSDKDEFFSSHSDILSDSVSLNKNNQKISHNIVLSKHIIFKTFGIILKNRIINGDEIEQFEKTFSEYIGTKHAISISSARMALYLILKSLDVHKGDEILIPSYMLPLLPQVSIYCGLKPVFVDVDPNTLTIDPNEIEKKISKNTKIILAVHIFGQPCEMEKIERIANKHGLILIEDCAQALGAEYKGKKTGTFGKISYFSFSETKDINTYGGGMIVTNDDVLNHKIREEIKNITWPKKSQIIRSYIHSCIFWFFHQRLIFNYLSYPLLRIVHFFNKDFVFNLWKSKEVIKLSNLSEEEFLKKYCFRYTNLQAAIGLEQFKLLEKNNDIRIKNAEFLNNNLNVPSIKCKDGKCIYYRYCIKINNPKELLIKLFKSGILTTDGSYLVLSDLDMFKEHNCASANAQRISNQLLYLPVQYDLRKKDMMKIIHVLNKHVKIKEHEEERIQLVCMNENIVD